MKTTLQMLTASLSVFLLLPGGVFAQEQVTGTVRDADDNQPLPGVNIVVKGTSQGTASGIDGSFELSVPSLSDTLVFSYVGYRTLEEPIAGRSQADVGLTSLIVTGEEIAVVGYGTQRKVDLTGSVAIVDVDALKRSSSPTIEGALQGTVSGVAVTSSGAPGETPEVRIRGISSFGNNDPQYVIDGVPVDNIIDFNMNDVESVQVLKDAAAAAIYGTRAAKGVVIITTKQGECIGEDRPADYSLFALQRWRDRNVYQNGFWMGPVV